MEEESIPSKVPRLVDDVNEFKRTMAEYMAEEVRENSVFLAFYLAL